MCGCESICWVCSTASYHDLVVCPVVCSRDHQVARAYCSSAAAALSILLRQRTVTHLPETHHATILPATKRNPACPPSLASGSAVFSVAKVDPATGEIAGVFESIQPSDTDLGAKAPKDVKITGLWYAQLKQ